MSDLLKTLKARLIPMGYTAGLEESLQIRRVTDAPRHLKADVLIRDLDPQRPTQPLSPSGSSTQTLTVEAFIEEEEDREHPYSAVVIYPFERRGEAVAWIELLSPSNKRRGLDARTYRSKRQELLNAGLVFVELDYLHETPPTFWRLADYSASEPDSYPYRIIVLDPRPDFKTGPVYLHQFDVDAPIPTAIIPLNAGDKLQFDFGVPYQKTFEEGLYGYDLDYSQLPLNFDRYSPADQVRIAARMLAVLKAAKAGVDLERNAPLPVKSMTLDDALAQIADMTV
jgi:hypothetical protein